MNNRSFIGSMALILFALNIYGQNKKEKEIKKADQYYNSFSYIKARSIYQDLAKDTSNHAAVIRMAECNYYLNNWAESEKLLCQVVHYTEVEPRYYLLYAHALKSNNKLKESDEWMTKFHARSNEDSRGVRYIQKNNHWEKILSCENKFSVDPVSFNSAEADFSPCLYKNNQLVFTSARKIKPEMIQRFYSWNERPFLDIYTIDLQNDKTKGKGSPFLPMLNTRLHDGPLCFDSSYTVMYLTRNTVAAHHKNKKEEGVNHLKLYKYRNQRGQWTAPEPLPFNSDEYSSGHACLSPDQRKLFFVSDMPGGKGGSDIYYVEVKEDGTYGPVTNLGPTINTEGNEMFPFLDEQGTLFFASDGHPGLGRLDIFHSFPQEDGSYGHAINTGALLNSPQDDFGIIFQKGGKEGYLSSNRTGGKGDDDLYHFTLANPITQFSYITISVNDKESKLPVAGAELLLYDKTGKVLKKAISDAEGKYRLVQDNSGFSRIGVNAVNFKPEQKEITEGAADREVAIELVKAPMYTYELSLYNTKTKAPLANAHITLTNKVTGETFTGTTNDAGKASIGYNATGNFQMEVKLEAKGYIHRTFIYRSEHGILDTKPELTLTEPELGMDVGKEIEISPIYFNTGKYDILPAAATELDKIVAFMNEFPTSVIQLQSHSDSR